MNIYWKNVINGFFTDPNNWVQGVVPGAGDIAELTSSCAFRRSRPGIPSEGGRLYRLKPAGDSDDPGHLLRRSLVSASSSGQLAGSASSF